MAVDITKCKRVRVHKPKPGYTRCWPMWTKGLDQFDGKIVDVREPIPRGYLGSDEDAIRAVGGWFLRASWCEPVDDAAFTPAPSPSDGKLVLPTDALNSPEATGETRLSPPYGLLSEQAPKPRGLYRSAYCRRCGASAEWGCMCPRGE